MAGERRYVLVEFRGGPKDGECEVRDYPPLPVVDYPAPSLPVVAACADAPTSSEPFPVHRYATTDDQNYEIVTVSEELLVRTREHPFTLAKLLLEGRRPMIYTHTHGG
jgi:hypothetical protein